MSIRLKDTIYNTASYASDSDKLDGISGDVYMQYKSGTIPATAGWYRIATTASGISNNIGTFQIYASTSSYHTDVTLNAGTSYGVTAGTTLLQMACAAYSNMNLTKARIVYHTSYSGNYAYLEVYHSVDKTNSIGIKFCGHGWTLIDPTTAGSIPSGYSTKEITFTKDAIVAPSFKGTADVANKLGTGTVGSSTEPIYLSSGAATACSGRTVPGIKSASGKTDSGWGTNNTYVVDSSLLAYWNGAYSGTSSNLTYCTKGTFGSACTYGATSSVTSGSGSLVTSGGVYTALQGYSTTGHTHSYLPLSGGTLTGDLEVKNSSGTRNLFLTGSTTSLRLFAWDTATYIETGNSDFSSNVPLRVTGISGKTGSDLHLNFTNIYCRSSDYVNIDSGNYSSYAATKNHNHDSSYAAKSHTHDYAASSHTHSYLPLSGGTMTGTITVKVGSSGVGLKFGTSTLNSLNNQLLWQSAEAIRFGSSDWDWNSWAGLKYNHSSKIIYLGLADNTIFNANSAQSGGKIYTPGVSSIYIGNGSHVVLHSNNWSTYCAAASHTHSYAASSHTHNYAGSDSAGGKAYDLYAHGGGPGSSNGVGVRWYTMTSTSSGAAGYAGTNAGFPVNNNANGMLWLGNHSGPYGGQLGISSNGRLYYRFISNGSFSTSANGGSWNRIAWTGDLSSYVTISGAQTISGKKTFSGGAAITSASENTSMPFFLGIDAFADGGTIKYISKASVCSCIGAATASHSHSYIPLSGGTLSSGTSRISRAGSSVSWYQGRANAMIYISSYSGYNAIASMKTTNGDWSMGVYSDNKMYFTYVQDTHYNSSTNTTTAQIVFQPNGYIVGNLSGYATSAGNADTCDSHHFSTVSSLPGSPNASTVYFIV